MSNAQLEPENPSDRLDEEAAMWFARMRGPDAEVQRAAFEAWLARGAAQRSAYNRAADVFAMGKLLADPESVPTRPLGRTRVNALALCALGVIAVGALGVMQILSPSDPARQEIAAPVAQRETYATIAGETRTVSLADGSTLVLGPDSQVAIAFDSAGRRLRLLQGQARFDVAHEPRPFVVFAAGGSITARGTIFEVLLRRAGRVDVRLLEGQVDVALPRRAQEAPVVRRLQQGERIEFETGIAASALAPLPPSAPTGARDYDGVTVAALVSAANRGAARPIRLADPALGERRVSGRFRIDDTALLAERLAVLYDSKLDRRNDREIVLMR